MARQQYDIASKWLLHNQGQGTLLVGGLKGVRRVEPMPGEIVQNRKYPDGLLRVYLAGQRKPHYILIEVATFSEERALRQALEVEGNPASHRIARLNRMMEMLDSTDHVLVRAIGPKPDAVLAHVFEHVLDVCDHQIGGRVGVLTTVRAQEAGREIDADKAAGFPDGR